MSQADELSKLVELRDRGAITEAEYGTMKRRVLSGGAKSSKLMTAAAGLVALVVIAGVAVKAYEKFSVPSWLACDDKDVLATAADVSNRVVRGLAAELAMLNPGGGAEDAIIRSISDAKAYFTDRDTGLVVCIANSHTDGGVQEIGYSVKWLDKSAGKYQVNLESPSDIRRRY